MYNIIAISGKMYSGKDTLTAMLMYRLAISNMKSKKKLSYEAFLSLYPDHIPENYKVSSHKHVSFAYPIYQIISILTGMSIDEIKANKLNYLPEVFATTKYKPLEEVVKGDTVTISYQKVKVNLTFRQLLTSLGRSISSINPAIFAAALLNKEDLSKQSLIISDLRIKAEYLSILQYNPLLIRLNRFMTIKEWGKVYKLPELDSIEIPERIGAAEFKSFLIASNLASINPAITDVIDSMSNYSEVELDEHTFDMTFNNTNNSLEDLWKFSGEVFTAMNKS